MVLVIHGLQVPQVTEDIAHAVIDLYPTLLSLARAYLLLVGTLSRCIFYSSLIPYLLRK